MAYHMKLYWTLKLRKRRKLWHLQTCRLAVYLKRTPLNSSFWKFTKIFKTSLKKLVRGSFLITLQLGECKLATPNKKKFLEIFRIATFRNISYHSVPGKFQTISKQFSPGKHFPWKSENLFSFRDKATILQKFENFQNFRACSSWVL